MEKAHQRLSLIIRQLAEMGEDFLVAHIQRDGFEFRLFAFQFGFGNEGGGGIVVGALRMRVCLVVFGISASLSTFGLAFCTAKAVLDGLS